MRRLALLSLLLHATAAAALVALPRARPSRLPEEPARIEIVFGSGGVPATPETLAAPAVAPGEGERATPSRQAMLHPAAADPGLRVEHPDDSFVPVRDDPGNTAPDYPPEAWRRGEQGTVLLRIHVSPDGRVAQVETLSSSGHPALDDAAQRAIARWHFLPARRDGETVASYRDQPMVFVIK